MSQHQIPNPRVYRHLERWLNISHKFLAKEEPPSSPGKRSQDLPQGKAFGGMISKLYLPSKTPGESCYSSLSHVWLCDPVDCSPPGSSVHEILQARILEWVAIPFSKGSFQPRDWTQVSYIAGRFFTIWVTREADGIGPRRAKSLRMPTAEISWEKSKCLLWVQGFVLNDKNILEFWWW